MINIPNIPKSFIRAFLTIVLFSSFLTASAQDDFQAIFNGKDLTGWEGSSALWKVEDGMIVGTTAGTELQANTFLIYSGAQVQNFHLKAKLRMLGDNNSGIMYRAQPVEGDKYALAGPQMDIHPKLEYQGMYYSEKTGRGIVAQRGQKVLVPEELNSKGKTTPQVTGDLGKEPSFDLSQWNTYEIIVVGRRSIHKINGVITVDVTDRDPSLVTKGSIGLQLHRGPEMTIFVKDIELKHLRGEELKEALKEALKK